jgi:hypothetical protein
MRNLRILRSKSQTVPAAKPLLTHSFNCGFLVSRESGKQRERREGEKAELRVWRAERVCRAESAESGVSNLTHSFKGGFTVSREKGE